MRKGICLTMNYHLQITSIIYNEELSLPSQVCLSRLVPAFLHHSPQEGGIGPNGVHKARVSMGRENELGLRIRYRTTCYRRRKI